MSKTDISIEVVMLKKNVSSCTDRIKSLRYSLKKINTFFPLTVKEIAQLSEEQKESIDAFILRYTQCVSMLQVQLFKGILIAEQEDFKDKSILMERLNVIQSAKNFGLVAVLGSKFAHHYPEETKDQLDKLNKFKEESECFIEVFEHIVEFIRKKDYQKKDLSEEVNFSPKR